MEFRDLSTGNKLFILLLVLQIWLSFMSSLGNLLIGFSVNFEGFNFIIFGLLFSILICSCIAFWAIFNSQPPYHLAIYPAIFINLLLAIGDPTGLQMLNIVNAILLLYFQIRDPIPVDPFYIPKTSSIKEKKKQHKATVVKPKEIKKKK
jgi:hypothetical protein